MALDRAQTIALGAIPFVFLVLLVVYISGPGSDLLDIGVTLPELTIEKVDFVGSEIHVTVRNTGPIPLEVAMADVNDRIQPAAVEPDGSLGRFETSVVRIPFEWNEAEPYVVGITIGDGTRFEKEVEAAAPAQTLTLDRALLFAVVGTYVGVIPVMIGLMWLPFIRRIGRKKYHFFLALTVGLLLFLAADSLEEAVGISDDFLASGFNGTLLVVTVVALSFLALYYAGERLAGRTAGPATIALMVSVGIGLHNFGEGLAIGAAVGLGSVAFSTFLIVGFALHNTTEGIAIAAPISQERPAIKRLVALGLVAGTPAIFGAWIGGFAYSPFASVVFLAIGAGAIFQVITAVLRWIKEEDRSLSSPAVISGLATGLLVMYLTSILA